MSDCSACMVYLLVYQMLIFIPDLSSVLKGKVWPEINVKKSGNLGAVLVGLIFLKFK